MDITSCNLLKLFLVSYSLLVSYMKDKPSVYAGENKEELPDEDTSEGRKKMEFIMKLSKLIFTTLAAAAVIGFAGCKLSEDEEKAFNGENFSLVEDGTKGNYYRSFACTAQKHFSANATLTVNDVANVANLSSSNVSKGVVGFVFGVKKDSRENYFVKQQDNTYKKQKVDFYDFGIVGVRYNAHTKKVEWYVDWEKNVPDIVFNYNDSADFSGTLYSDANGSSAESFGTEEKIRPSAGNWEQTSLELVGDKLIAFVRVTAEDNGDYKVTLCDCLGVAVDDCSDVVIPASKTGNTAKEQGYIGRYISVYKDQAMTGSVQYSDVQGNLIPAEYEIIEE